MNNKSRPVRRVHFQHPNTKTRWHLLRQMRNILIKKLRPMLRGSCTSFERKCSEYRKENHGYMVKRRSGGTTKSSTITFRKDHQTDKTSTKKHKNPRGDYSWLSAKEFEDDYAYVNQLLEEFTSLVESTLPKKRKKRRLYRRKKRQVTSKTSSSGPKNAQKKERKLRKEKLIAEVPVISTTEPLKKNPSTEGKAASLANLVDFVKEENYEGKPDILPRRQDTKFRFSKKRRASKISKREISTTDPLKRSRPNESIPAPLANLVDFVKEEDNKGKPDVLPRRRDTEFSISKKPRESTISRRSYMPRRHSSARSSKDTIHSVRSVTSKSELERNFEMEQARRLYVLLKDKKVPNNNSDMDLLLEYGRDQIKYNRRLMLVCPFMGDEGQDPCDIYTFERNYDEIMQLRARLTRLRKSQSFRSSSTIHSPARQGSLLSAKFEQFHVDEQFVEGLRDKWTKFFESQEKTRTEIQLAKQRQHKLELKQAQEQSTELQQKAKQKLRPISALHTEPRQTQRMRKVMQAMTALATDHDDQSVAEAKTCSKSDFSNVQQASGSECGECESCGCEGKMYTELELQRFYRIYGQHLLQLKAF